MRPFQIYLLNLHFKPGKGKIVSKLTINIEVEYDLAESESIDDIAKVMGHAVNTIIGDRFLSCHDNISSSVRDYIYSVKTQNDQDALSLDPGQDGCDYTLNEGHRGVWLTIGSLSTHVIRTDDGVVVDIYPKGDEGSDPIASTWAFDCEGVDK